VVEKLQRKQEQLQGLQQGRLVVRVLAEDEPLVIVVFKVPQRLQFLNIELVETEPLVQNPEFEHAIDVGRLKQLPVGLDPLLRLLLSGGLKEGPNMGIQHHEFHLHVGGNVGYPAG